MNKVFISPLSDLKKSSVKRVQRGDKAVEATGGDGITSDRYGTGGHSRHRRRWHHVRPTTYRGSGEPLEATVAAHLSLPLFLASATISLYCCRCLWASSRDLAGRFLHRKGQFPHMYIQNKATGDPVWRHEVYTLYSTDTQPLL